MPNCTILNCSQPAKHKGLCGMHYKRQWRHGDPEKTLIAPKGTNLTLVCSVDNCSRLAHGNGLCKMHHTRFSRYGRVENIIASKGEGRPLTSAGYILLTIQGKRIYEHIYIAEQALGRPLPSKAVVHHSNCIPWDNRHENLVVCPDQAYHLLLHRRMREMQPNQQGT